MPSFEDYCALYCMPEGSPAGLDVSRMGLTPEFFAEMEPRLQAACDAMEQLEAGATANPDENRMVGHYWLRDFARIPDAALRQQVEADHRRLMAFLADVHSGKIKAPSGRPFRRLLSIGIGGSALGPQFLAHALGRDGADRMEPHFMDNTDPDGIARVLGRLNGYLDETLCVVISKSGGTAETRNGMVLAEKAWQSAGLDFGPHAVAITGDGSKLDMYAKEGGWLDRFPMYDWVGGRTSVMSGVGLLPAGLQGLDIEALLAGARDMDVVTRTPDVRANPALLLALCWYHASGGRGEKDMVVLPYKDRLELFSRYLQQLIMESLGKELDLDGKRVEQGLTVYGNKGSTDQHAYVQQLRDGVPNFFAVFIEVLHDGAAAMDEVEEGVTAGDYLSGFFQGTRRALSEKDRQNLTITIEEVSAYTVGGLIALFERAVGFYASLINVNAYHQPGVEAGKKAAGEVLKLQRALVEAMGANPGEERSAAEWAQAAGSQDAETAYLVLRHLAANERGVTGTNTSQPGKAVFRAG